MPEETVDTTAVEETPADQYKPEAAEIAVQPDDPQGPMVAMDRADEAQILDEIQGRALGAMLYSFEQAGSTLTGLSYAGVLECVRTVNARGFGKIRIVPGTLIEEVVEEDGEVQYRATVYAEDEMTGGGQYGTAMMPRLMKARGKLVVDKFARTKALSKAQRNALDTLIPMELRKTLEAQFLKDPKRVQRIASAAEQKLAELPPPDTSDEALALVEKAREVYREVQALGDGRGRMVVTPGRFHAYLTQAQHSAERLQEFVAYLEEQRDVHVPAALEEKS
jgi:hypothetical protein